MALNFFDYDQLTRGTYEGEQQEKQTQSTLDPRRPASKQSSLRVNVPELRRLQSENTLRQQERGLNSPSSPSGTFPTTIRPVTAGNTKREQREQRTGGLSSHPPKEDRPLSSQSRRTDVSRKSLAARSLHKIRLVRVGGSKKAERPKSSGQESIKEQKRQRRKSWKEKQKDQQKESEKEQQTTMEPAPAPATQRSRANTMRDKASTILQQLTNLAASRAPPLPQTMNPAPLVKPDLNKRQVQFLSEALAHVTVGEWLFKDHNRPSMIPRNNPFRRQTGPPARGSTGLPQRRWFRISPYDRKVMWSSKWDASSLDQLKSNRQVPVQLVFETSSNALFQDCLPDHLIPFKRSIVIVAPSRIVKITAPDEERHRLWLTALRYIAESTVKLDEEKWATELRARFELLGTDDLSFPEIEHYASGARTGVAPPPTNRLTSGLVDEKPLPPSPPRSTFSRSAITPPVVPRWLKHGKNRSEGVSTVADDAGGDYRLPSRGSGNEPVPALQLPGIETGDTSLDMGRASSTEKRSEDRRSSHSVEEDDMGEPSNKKRDSRQMDTDEVAFDQMINLVDRLGNL